MPKSEKTSGVIPIKFSGLVVFKAPWCQPCKKMKPELEKLEADGVEVISIDVEEHPLLASDYGVMSVPTLFRFGGLGNADKSYVGFRTHLQLREFMGLE